MSSERNKSIVWGAKTCPGLTRPVELKLGAVPGWGIGDGGSAASLLSHPTAGPILRARLPSASAGSPAPGRAPRTQTRAERGEEAAVGVRPGSPGGTRRPPRSDPARRQPAPRGSPPLAPAPRSAGTAGPRRHSSLAPARLPGPDPSPGPAAASAAEGRKDQVSRRRL